MTRIAENQLARSILADINDNRALYDKYSNEVSSGLKVTDPGDTKFASTISQYRNTLDRIEGHSTRISAVGGLVSFQDNVVAQAADIMVRAKELAAQAVNETIGASQRTQMAKEVFELREHLVQLANSQYQGKYIYNGLVDDKPPFNALPANAYTVPVPATEAAAKRYTYDTTNPATGLVKNVNVTDEVQVAVNTPGNQVFDSSIQALERLGRALAGYSTNPASGAPDGTGAAYNLPTDMAIQTQDIAKAMDQLEAARQGQLMPERVSLGARLKRLDTAKALLDLTKTDAKAVLSGLQDADYATSATNLSQAQTALEASYTVNARILKLSILDYI